MKELSTYNYIFIIAHGCLKFHLVNAEAMTTENCIYYSKIRGYHVYKEVWSAVVGETLACHRETRNLIDPYAVAVMRSGEVVGYVPHSISTFCSLFIELGGNIMCEATGNRQYSDDLGLELHCKLVFFGPNKEIAKVKYLLQFPPCKALCDIKADSSLPSVKRMSPVVSAAGDAPVVSAAAGSSVLLRKFTFPSNSINFAAVSSNAANSMVMSSGDSGNSVTVSNSAANSFIQQLCEFCYSVRQSR